MTHFLYFQIYRSTRFILITTGAKHYAFADHDSKNNKFYFLNIVWNIYIVKLNFYYSFYSKFET